MRPFTKIAIAVLFLLIGLAAVFQAVLASRDQPRYPGPVPGTPYPSVTAP